MKQPQNIDLSSLEKVLSIGIVILVVIIVTAIVTGVGVYFWQKSINEDVRQNLLAQISKLQDEINALKEENSDRPVQTNKSEPELKVEKEDQVYKIMLAGREQEVITALKSYDLHKLASLVHPSKGVRFSPYSYIESKQDLRFSAGQIRNMDRDNNKYHWGYYDTTGLPIELSFREYYKSFIYDRDYANVSEIGYNQSVTNSITVGNIFDVYPKAVVAEYRFSKTNPNSQLSDWRNLKLVFEEKNQIWYLTGIIHDQWVM